MYKFSQSVANELVKIGRPLKYCIESKRSQGVQDFAYDRSLLKSIETKIFKRTRSLESASDLTLEAVVDCMVQQGELDPFAAFKYIALHRALDADPIYISYTKDGVCEGRLRPRIGCEVNGDYISRETIYSLCGAVEFSDQYDNFCKDMMAVERAFVFYVAVTMNRDHIVRYLERCPLCTLESLQDLIQCIGGEVDQRHIVSDRYVAEVNGKRISWSGRGVQPKVWTELFARHGRERFDLKSEKYLNRPVELDGAFV